MKQHFELGNKDDAFDIRTQVFIKEQGFENEFDAIDETALHITLYVDDTLVGCARTFPDKQHPGRYIFGRLAVLPEFRKKGLGGMILTKTEQNAQEAGATEMHLHAQCSVIPFYESFGYVKYGQIELDEHVEHIWMEKKF